MESLDDNNQPSFSVVADETTESSPASTRRSSTVPASDESTTTTIDEPLAPIRYGPGTEHLEGKLHQLVTQETRNLHFEDSPRERSMIYSVPSETLWMLLRRFNKVLIAHIAHFHQHHKILTAHFNQANSACAGDQFTAGWWNRHKYCKQ